jgi:hypothetical protein
MYLCARELMNRRFVWSHEVTLILIAPKKDLSEGMMVCRIRPFDRSVWEIFFKRGDFHRISLWLVSREGRYPALNVDGPIIPLVSVIDCEWFFSSPFVCMCDIMCRGLCRYGIKPGIRWWFNQGSTADRGVKQKRGYYRSTDWIYSKKKTDRNNLPIWNPWLWWRLRLQEISKNKWKFLLILQFGLSL